MSVGKLVIIIFEFHAVALYNSKSVAKTIGSIIAISSLRTPIPNKRKAALKEQV
jgi:hypothetical protein